VLDAVAKALLAIVLWGAATIGFLRQPMRLAERALAIAAAAALVAALPLTDEIGFALAALVLGWHTLRESRSGAAALAQGARG